MKKLKILAIPGSLRAQSSSNQILKAIAGFVPSSIEFNVYNDIPKIPAFDDSDTVPESVANFRKQLREADGVLICTPEYAFGVPGALKNALDWTVSSAELPNKPMALVTASTGGEKGHAALLLILTALSAKVVDGGELLISFVRSKLNENGELKDPEVVTSLKSVIQSLITEITPHQKG